jgi:hypothetical protein
MTSADAKASGSWVLSATRKARIGILRLWYAPVSDQWAVSLDNRTYHNFVEITEDRLPLWRVEFGLCPEFRPDHNGECLNCDEWYDAHFPLK